MNVTTGDEALDKLSPDELIEVVVNQANEAWEYCKQVPLFEDVDKRLKQAEELRKVIKDKWPRFYQSYPITLRYMTDMRMYTEKALRKFLHHIKHHPWTDHEGYLDAQAVYAVCLLKSKDRKWDSKKTEALRKAVRESLQTEHREFIESTEAIQASVEAKERERISELRESTLAYYKFLHDNPEEDKKRGFVVDVSGI